VDRRYIATNHDLHGVKRPTIVLFCAASLLACSGPIREDPEKPTNRWADERLWPVLEAQEHRDTDALCTLLKHEEPEVREAAALAFASVQDTLGIPCLMGSLGDASANVRATAVFALGFVADSLTIERMAELAVNERDSTVLRAYLSASFLAMQRNGMLKDPQAILYYLESSSGHERVRAADGLRRMPDSIVVMMASEIDKLMRVEDTEVRQFLILAMLKLGRDVACSSLKQWAWEQAGPGEKMSVLLVDGEFHCSGDDEMFYAIGNSSLSMFALQVLRERPILDPHQCLNWEARSSELAWRIGLIGLALKHSPPEAKDSLFKQLIHWSDSATSAYDRAVAIQALADAPSQNPAEDFLRPLIRKGRTSIERIESFRTAMAFYADKTTGQVELLQEVIDGSNDPGMLSAVCEEIMAREKYRGFHWLFTDVLTSKLQGLQLPRDLEAQQLVHQTVAYLKGLPQPAHQPPPFNHPISKEKLRTLPQGQRYRITTEKGIIILATDINDCPGSSLAFDSLVTAGYYNGKAFHRMVPNFVVQGGCPRGDGYGGMPWTLRTEIGRKLFTAGSVGLASAGRDTESCQFFITHSAAPHLDGRYTRFGEVVEGMDVVWQLQVGDVMERVERID
jgi:cyclophilin family peptidyl-prolyl cis-trans isomerase